MAVFSETPDVPLVTQLSGGSLSPATLARLNTLAQVGVSGISWAGAGQFHLDVFTVGNNQPASTGADIVLHADVWTAGLFSQQGSTVVSTLVGTLGVNSNAKQIKMFLNPTSAVLGQPVVGGYKILDSGLITNPIAGGQFCMQNSILKYGVFGSNTQVFFTNQITTGNQSLGIGGSPSPTTINLVENQPLPFCFTANATSATTDITFVLHQAYLFN